MTMKDKMKKTTIVQADINDAQIFFDARYSEQANMMMIDKTIPSYSSHMKWYCSQQFENMYVIKYDMVDVGYLRVRAMDGDISIAVLPDYQKNGCGTVAIKSIIDKYDILHARIFEDNYGSIQLFKKFPEIEIELLKR